MPNRFIAAFLVAALALWVSGCASTTTGGAAVTAYKAGKARVQAQCQKTPEERAAYLRALRKVKKDAEAWDCDGDGEPDPLPGIAAR